MSTMYSIGQMNQLGDALEAAGFTPNDVTMLRSFSRLGEIKNVLRGFAEIVAVKHIIDCNVDPFIPKRWKVEKHIKHGMMEWSSDKVRLHLSPNQNKKDGIQGYDLRKELEKEPTLNANVLDYLLSHKELIPEEWKGKTIFFWGTVFRDSDGDLCVRYLYWDGRWCWGCRWLDSAWDGGLPAALLASN